MKQFGKILRFEFFNYLKNKTFVGMTIFLVVLLVVVMFFPRILEAFELGTADGETPGGSGVMLILGGEDTEMIRAAFSDAFPGYEVRGYEGTVDALSEQIATGEAACAFVFDGLMSFDYYVETLSMYDSNVAIASEVLVSLYRAEAMIGGGLSAEAVQGILSAYPESETVRLGKDQMQNFFYTYIMIFALYMMILLYGQMVATNVATEKSSRAMELLITSVKPTSMMFGKVIASCLAGFSQLVIIFGTALVSYRCNEAYWGAEGMMASFFDIPLDLLVYMLIFFVLGFLVYAFLYGAIGSTVSKLEDISTAVMPITYLFLAGFMVSIFSMSSGEVDNILMRICSYVPFTSPMAMFTRIAMSTVPLYEIVISILVLILSVFGIGVVSAKIYRVGVLLYGTRPKIGAILKAIRKA